MKLLISILTIAGLIIGLISIVVRAIESIYQLSQTIDLSSYAKIKQFLVNFFTVETYPTK
jgi:hypothetical protein